MIATRTYITTLSAAFLVLLLSLSQCKPSVSSEQQDDRPDSALPEVIAEIDLDKIKERGYLTALMDNSSTGLFLYRGRTMGYEYELVKRFAQSQNLELKIKLISSLEEGFDQLNAGEGDILAYNLTITKERKKRIAFTHYHNQVKQVLVQRKPEGWRQMKLHEIENSLIRNPIELIGKEVHVRHHSAYLDRLRNLSDEMGGDIIIVQEDPDVETESIIRKVAQGEIAYTVTEEDIAMVNATYYPNLDVGTPVSLPTQIAWGVRKNADSLLSTLNNWIVDMRRTSDYYVIYNKYFKNPKASLKRNKSDYFPLAGGNLSPYDSLIQNAADTLDWDWRLLAALIFKESGFNPNAKSWAGAIGLMQVLPQTGEIYGVEKLSNPGQNIQAGTQHLLWLSDYFEDVVVDEVERKKFIMAAYNVGHGHVNDAISLTRKYGENPNNWDMVKNYLLKKSKSEYYNDPVVEHGYCRGIEPVTYVERIESIYENYKALYPDETSLASESM